jgi:hypothetical protein
MIINSTGKTLLSAAVVALGAFAFAAKKKSQNKQAAETTPDFPTEPKRNGNNESSPGTDSTNMNS